MRNLALCRVCGTDGATVKHSNPFLPVTRPLSFTGERERCSVLRQGGDAPAWPPFCWIVDCRHSEDNSDTETMGRLFTQIIRPTRPPGRSGPLDRTAGGIGGAAPASLDLYGQSRILTLHSWRHILRGLRLEGLFLFHGFCYSALKIPMCKNRHLRRISWPSQTVFAKGLA